jgi:hypothetical protein
MDPSWARWMVRKLDVLGEAVSAAGAILFDRADALRRVGGQAAFADAPFTAPDGLPWFA